MSDEVVRLAPLRRLYALIGQVNAGRTLAETLQAVVDAVVDGLGFGVAVVNYVHTDGSFETVAVAGPADARAQLLGTRAPADEFALEFAVAEDWDGLRFVPHDRLPAEAMTGWVPPIEVPEHGNPDDLWHPMDALFAPLHGPDGTLVGMLSVDMPDDGRRPGPLQRELLRMFATQAGIAIDNLRLTEALYASEEAFRLAFEGAGIGMTLISLDPADPGRLLRVNDAMCAITGYTAEELMQRTFADITHPDDLAANTAAMTLALTDEDAPVYRAEKRYLRRDGSVVWVALTTSVVRTPSGGLLYGISQVEDITARRDAEIELRHRAAHDQLTGLANRATFTDRLTLAVEGLADPALDDKGPGAVLFCDLDGFKSVNDTYGHDVGDTVLRVIAARLVQQVRATDTVVARLGGDEFVVLSADLTLDDAEGLAGRIGRAVAAPISLGAMTVELTVSIGIAPLSHRSPGQLLRDADTAMYAAKAAGKNMHVLAARVAG